MRAVGVTMTLMLLAGCTPSHSESRDQAASGAASHPGPGAAAPVVTDPTVWYMGHCGFAVQVGARLLVFDYVPNLGTPSPTPGAGGFADGVIEGADLRGLEVFVFASHDHGDHYHPVILDWDDGGRGIHYFFGWQEGDDPSHHYMLGPGATVEVDGVRVYTVTSEPDGIPEVAYLVEVGGLRVYHNGDHFTEGPEDLEYLAGITPEVDVAFVTGVPMPGARFFEKGMAFLERFRPGAVFPMHQGGREEVLEAWAAVPAERNMGLNVLLSRARGDRFEVGAGEGRP
jgi:L-ascorbate metabolism protein UlaG (beta-lactamase superfamily)